MKQARNLIPTRRKKGGTKTTQLCRASNGILEKKLCNKCGEIYGENEREYFIKLFKRVLDDCFLAWETSEEELKQFMTFSTVYTQKYSL